MRHRKRGRKLGRSPSHRKALRRNLVNSLFVHGQIITTVEKAKEYAPFAERMITLAKRAEVKAQAVEARERERLQGEVTDEMEARIEHLKRQAKVPYIRKAYACLQNKAIVKKVFREWAPLYYKRHGGYTRILKYAKRRLGDNAQQAVLALVEQLEVKDQKEKDKEEKKALKEKLKREKAERKRKQKERKAREKAKKKRIEEKKKAREAES